jgi:hypothetical protein
MPTSDTFPYQSGATQILFGEETTQGSAATPDTNLLVEDEAELPDPENDWIEQRPIGTGRTIDSKDQGRQTFEGATIPITVTGIDPFYWLLGSKSTTNNVTTVTPAASDDPSNAKLPPSQTIEATLYNPPDSNTSVRTFTGGVPDSGSIQIANDDRVIVELDYTALDMSLGSSPTSVSLTTDEKWIFADTTPTGELNAFGTDFARVTDFQIDVNNNLQTGEYIRNSRKPKELAYGNAEIEASFTINPTDDTLLDKVLNGAEADADIVLDNGSKKLTVTAKNLGLESAPHSIPMEDKVEVEASGVANGLEIKVDTS